MELREKWGSGTVQGHVRRVDPQHYVGSRRGELAGGPNDQIAAVSDPGKEIRLWISASAGRDAQFAHGFRHGVRDFGGNAVGIRFVGVCFVAGDGGADHD